jgi:CheY-like chemotaxis protein
MTALHVLAVDDEPDIREVVEISLRLDPELIVRSCSSGREAIAVAGDWSPDLVLLDVMMPGMDGPTTLVRLRESPRTRDVPVIFMTARTQSREIEAFLALGAKGVIAKPFDPLTLASLVRSRMRERTDGEPVAAGVPLTQSDEIEVVPASGVRSVAVGAPDRLDAPAEVRNLMRAPDASFDGQRERFLLRARTDEMALVRDRQALARGEDQTSALERVQAIAHRLAGGAGICGLDEIGNQAFALEEATTAELAGAHTTEIATAIDALVNVIDRA